MNLLAKIWSSRGKAFGSGNYGYAPHGSRYNDAFRKDKSPTPRELIQLIVKTAYACINLNAGALAASKLRLYQIKGKGSAPTRKISVKQAEHVRKAAPATVAMSGFADEIEEVTEHPALELLKNPEIGTREDLPPNLKAIALPAFEYRYLTQTYLESVGRAYWLKETDGLQGLANAMGVDQAPPARLPMLPAHLVQERPDQANGGIQCYEIMVNGRVQQFAPSQVIRLRMADPIAPHFGGYSPLMSIVQTLKTDLKMDASAGAILDNAIRPMAIWSPKGDSEGGGIGEVEARRIRAALNQELARAGNGGVLISETPGQLTPWAGKMDGIDEGTAERTKNAIANAFGVPNAFLDLNAANLASSTTADLQYAKLTMIPRHRRWESALNSQLLPCWEDTEGMFFAFDSPIPDDKIFALEQSKFGADNGVIKVNEARASIGLGPEEGDGGELRYVTAGLVAVLPDGTIAPPTMQPGAAAAPGTPETKSFRYRRKGSEDQPRDDHGRFASSEGLASAIEEAHGKPAIAEINRRYAAEKNGNESDDARAERVYNDVLSHYPESAENTLNDRGQHDGALSVDGKLDPKAVDEDIANTHANFIAQAISDRYSSEVEPKFTAAEKELSNGATNANKAYASISEELTDSAKTAEAVYTEKMSGARAATDAAVSHFNEHGDVDAAVLAGGSTDPDVNESIAEGLSAGEIPKGLADAIAQEHSERFADEAVEAAGLESDKGHFADDWRDGLISDGKTGFDPSDERTDSLIAEEAVRSCGLSKQTMTAVKDDWAADLQRNGKIEVDDSTIANIAGFKSKESAIESIKKEELAKANIPPAAKRIIRSDDDLIASIEGGETEFHDRYGETPDHLRPRTGSKNFNPDQPRGPDGRFGSGGTGGEKPSPTLQEFAQHLDTMTPRDLGNMLANFHHKEEVGMEAVDARCKATIAKLPDPPRTAAAKAYQASRWAIGKMMASYSIGEAAVEKVAMARGMSPDEAQRVRSICTTLDHAAVKAVGLPLHLAGAVGPIAETAIGFTPLASVSYLAASAARNPILTIKAAMSAIREHISKKSKDGASKDDTPAVNAIADALDAHDGDDWYFALLSAAMDACEGDAGAAVEVADKAYKKNSQGVKLWQVKDRARVPAGQPGGGEFVGGSGEDEESHGQKPDVQRARTKSEIAKQSATLTGKDVQRWAEEHNEPQFAKAIGGLAYKDNEPIDVVSGAGGKIEHGIEMKTMVSNKASKLTMDKYAQVRKVEWEKNNGATFHTVVVDDRSAGIGSVHDSSKRVYYYRRGIAGSARIDSMHKCKNLAEVKKLMTMPESELPDGAQRTDATIRSENWRPLPAKDGIGYRNSSGDIVRPKK